MSVLLPLMQSGLAMFQGTSPSSVMIDGDLVATGTWGQSWCGDDHEERPIGPGTVHLRWEGDPSTLRAWESVRRGAF